MSRYANRTAAGARSPAEAARVPDIPEAPAPDPRPPVVTGVFPADGALDVPTDLVLVLTFSQPMDTASVEAALSLTKLTSQRG